MAEHQSTEGAGSGTIAVPADFPVAWENPGDELLYWSVDRMHFAEPMSPMSEFFREAFNTGFRRASVASDVPVAAPYGRFNNFFYYSVEPQFAPEEMEAVSKRGAVKLEQNMARLWEWWTDELLPEVQGHLVFWDSVDTGKLTMEQLLQHLDETMLRLKRLWDIHFQIAFPFLVGPSMFQELYAELIGGARISSWTRASIVASTISSSVAAGTTSRMFCEIVP